MSIVYPPQVGSVAHGELEGAQPAARAGNLDVVLDDARELLHYASEKGIQLAPELISGIVDAQGLKGVSVWDEKHFDAQKKFWAALTILSEAVKPATPQTLRFSRAQTAGLFATWIARFARRRPRTCSMAEAAVNRARGMALAALLCVAAIQAYYEVATATVAEYDRAVEVSRRQQQQVDALQQTAEAAGPAAPASAAPGSGGSNEAPTASVRIAAAKFDLERVQDTVDRRLALSRQMLFWRAAAPADPDEAAEDVIGALEGMIIILRDSLLPMFWGLLGAALYVSRSLADDIRSSAYGPERLTLYRSRFYMGMVAGYVVAKVIPQTDGSVASSVTPFALALLVGYSVEVLFSLLDKIISTFSAK